MGKNLICLCDKHGNIKESEEKISVHQMGKLHKAFSIFVLSGEDVLLQKRASNKYHSPLLWSNACCSHYTEKGRDVNLMLRERFKEEMGADITDIKHLFNFRYKVKLGDLYENEYDSIFVAKLCSPINACSLEVFDYKFINYKLLSIDMKKHKKAYSYWLRKCYKKFIQFSKLNNLL